MGKIDTTNWGTFKISEFCKTNTKNKKLQVPTGANVPIKDLDENGTTPRITVTGVNNGVFGSFDYIGKKPADYRVFNNFISVSFLGTVFYQENDASLDMKVHCVKPLNVTLNKYTGKFLATAIKASLRDAPYSDQISSTVLPNMEIKLPIDSEGNPDWSYMEDYMKSIENSVIDSLSKLESSKDAKKKQIDVTGWEKYHIHDIFNIDMGNKFDKSKMTNINPTINFVGRANANNGITMEVDAFNDTIPYEAGYLTLSLGGEYLGSCFIQPKQFYTSQNVVVLKPINPMSDYIKKYLCLMIFKEARTHYKAFSDELNRHIKTDFEFPLPTINGQPDWYYMEDYMKSIENSVNDKLPKLESIAL